MKFSIAVLTFNRKELFLRTLRSLHAGKTPLTLVDNGSSDGTEKVVARLSGYCNRDGNHTVGHGMNLAIARALEVEPDLVLFTADDYEYVPGWQQQLLAFWTEAPAEVALVSANLEPDYRWNTPLGVVDAGGVRALSRKSVPGSNWSFRASDWPLIGPIRETTGGEDLEICTRLRAQGRLLCALDLTVHIGARQSSWGNQSWRVARPLHKEQWGL